MVLSGEDVLRLLVDLTFGISFTWHTQSFFLPQISNQKYYSDRNILLMSYLSRFIGNLDQSSQSRHFLESVISRSLDKIANTKSHKLDAPVPVISITVGESSKSTSVDISMNRIGELKTRFIQSLYKSNPVVFPFMWILVRWARCVGLVKSAESSECLIATAEFYILVIHLMKLNDCETKNPKRPVSYYYSTYLISSLII